MADIVTKRAHGRVNLIGEHTDYNGGWVLPTAIPQYTQVRVQKIPGQMVTITSSKNRHHIYELGKEEKTQTWIDYLQGGTQILGNELAKKGQYLSGFVAHIESTIPEGSGLSSSAALEMSFLKALQELFHLDFTDIELAQIGQRIENEFVGANVGIMDQMATSLAKDHEALFLDTLTLTYENIPLPIHEMEILVINSGVSHRLSASDGGYNQRRSECEEAAKILGVNFLREIKLEDLKKIKLPEELLKRVRHVVTENARVFSAVEAIRKKDILTLGKLFIASHLSMRDDFKISIPEIDTLVELSLQNPHVYGARLTGGGFGGSVVILTRKGFHHEVAQSVMPIYEKKTGHKASLLA